MKAIAFLLLLCLAGYVATDYAWKVGYTYTYDVRGRVFTGLSQHTQYSGLQVEYQMQVTAVGPNTIHLKPQNFKAVEVNNKIQGGFREGVLENESPAQINGQLQDYLESPIEMTMRQGVVDSIKVDGQLPTWAVNIKKAQASHFVLDTSGANVVINGNLNRQSNSVSPDQANQESGFFYETMEQTVHGECETYYTVSQNGPFDAPFQYQKQAQPVQNDDNSDENDAPSQEQNNDDTDDSSENNKQNKYKNYENYQQYAAYKQMAQRGDSGSAEDSYETNQGELPWPQAFNNYCQQGDQIYEIVKSINFTTCRNKPVLAYSTAAGLSDRPGDNSLGSLWQRSVNTRFIACGRSRKQYTILNVVQDEQTNYGLHLQQRTLAATVQNLTLTDISRASGQPDQVQQPKEIHDLTYTFDPQEQKYQREGRLQQAFSGFDDADENDDDDNGNNDSQQEQQASGYSYSRRYYNQYGNNNNQNGQQPDQPYEYSQQQNDDDDQQQQYGQNKYAKQYYQNQSKSRKPRSTQYQYENNNDEDSSSQESSEESQEQQRQQQQQSSNNGNGPSDEYYYHTDAENRQFLKKPSMTNPPLNQMLISGLQNEGMKKRVSSLVEEIVQDIQDTQNSFAETETISKITTVARILRRLPYSANEQLFHKHAFIQNTDEAQIARNVFLDALVMAGNNPNVKLLFDEIQKKEIQGEEAAQIFMALPLTIRTPTQQLARAFYELVDSDALDYDEQVKTTAVLAFSKFLNQAYVNTRIRNSRYPVQVYGQFGDAKFVQRQFVPYFVQNLEKYLEKAEPQDKHWIVTYLNALGNLGVPEVVPQVQQILDNSIDPYIKTQAVFALKGLLISRQAENIPTEGQHGVDRNSQDHLTDKFIENQVLPVLTAVAFDRGEFPSTRMAAISLLLYTTNADVNIWQQLAYSTWFSSSQEVHSFIYTSLQNLAQVQGPLNSALWPMVKKARQVLALARPIAPGYAKSRNSFSAAYAENLQTGFAQQFQYFGAKDSNTPQFMYYRNFIQQGNGGESFSPLEFSAHGHTIQKLVDYFIDQVQQDSQKQQNLQEAHPEFLAIRQILGIEQREQEEEIEGSIQFTFRNEMQRIFSFNEQKIQQYIKQAQNQFYRQLTNGYPFNYQKTIQAVEHNVEFPSGLGIPVSFSYRLPVHLSLRGSVKYVQEQNGQDNQVVAEVHAVYGWKSHTRVAFKAPFTGKQYQAGIQRHMAFEAPLRASARYGPQGQAVFAISPAQFQKGSPNGQIDFFTYHQRPYTIIITDNLWPASHKEGGQMQVIREQPSASQQQAYKQSQSFGQEYFGLQFTFEEESDYRQESERISQWAKLVKSFHTPSCFFNLGWAGSQEVKFVERKLSLNVANSQTRTVAFIYGSKSHQNAQYRALWQDSSSQSSQSSEESASSESAQDSSSQQQQSTETRYGNQQARSPRNQNQNEGNDNDSSASSDDQNQGGQVYAVAFIGKTSAIKSAQDVKSIQKVLDNSKQSTFQYFFQYSQSNGRAYFRAASGDAANEAAAALPQNSGSLQAVSQAVQGASNAKSQPDGCAEFEGEYDGPNAYENYQLLVLRQQLLADELSAKVKGEFQFGTTCRHMPHEIKVAGKLQRGQQQTEYAQNNSPQAQQCKEDEDKGFEASQVCIQVAEQQAAAFNKGNFKVEFSQQLPEQFRNASAKAEDFFKALFYPYMSHDRTHEGAGQGKAQFNFRLTPDKEFISVEVIKPNSRLTFEDVKTNKFARAALPFTATQSFQQNVADRLFNADAQPSCTFQGNYVNTFDNVTYRFSSQAAEGCVHVLAQDCSNENPVAVLVKDIAADQNQVTIYLGQKTKIQLTPQGQPKSNAFQKSSKLQVQINGQNAESLPRAVRDQESGEPIVYVEQMNDGGVQVFSEHFNVATNGQYVAVYASNALRNQTCGMCGDFNGEKFGEMKSPKNCPLSSGSAFVASYAFQSQEQNDRSQCQIDKQLKQQIQQEEQQCLADEQYFSNNPQKYSSQQFQNQQQQQYFYNHNNQNQQNQNQYQNQYQNQNQNDQSQNNGNCKEQVQQQAKQVVYEVTNNFLKASVWNSQKRQRYAQSVAQKVEQQAENFLEEGTADKIAKAAAEAACASMQLIPAGPKVAQQACKGAQPLLRKAIRHAVNPICQRSQCCSPSYFTSSQMQEVENEISYAFADSAESEETDIPYVDNGSQSKLSCQKMLQKFLQGALPKQVRFQLQENQNQNQMSSSKATSLAENFKNQIPKAVQKTFQQGNQLADNLVNAADQAFGQQYQQQANQQHQLIRQYAKKAIEELNETTNGKCNFNKHNQA